MISRKALAARRKKVLKLADNTRSQRKIAMMLNVSSSVIRNDVEALKAAGHNPKIPTYAHGRILPKTVEKIRTLYATGEYSIEQIAELCNVSHVTASKYKDPAKVVKKHGLLPDLPSPDFTYEIVTSDSRIRHTSFTEDRAQAFALALCGGREIVAQGFVQ